MLSRKKIKKLFIITGIFIISYVAFIENHLYESNCSILIKNINGKIETPSLFGAISGQTSSEIQNLMILKEYITSNNMYDLLNQEFNLDSHYSSNSLDLLQRMYSWNSYENFFNLFKSRIFIEFDENASLLRVSFSHTSPEQSQLILNSIIKKAEIKLNEDNKELAIEHLKFINKEVNSNKLKLFSKIKELEKFQNSNKFLDPSSNAEVDLKILSSLQLELLKKENELNKLENYFTPKSISILNLKNEIKQINKNIVVFNDKLAGNNPKRLNKIIINFKKIENKVSLLRDIYKQSLLQAQLAKVEVNKQSMKIQTIIKPKIPVSYEHPNKFKKIITILLVLSFLYGILSMLISIIKDHKG